MSTKNFDLLTLTDDLVLPKIHTQHDPTIVLSAQEKLVHDLELMTSDELNEILKSSSEDNEEQTTEPVLTPDEQVINEMVQGLCTKKQKTTFVKIIARYIR